MSTNPDTPDENSAAIPSYRRGDASGAKAVDEKRKELERQEFADQADKAQKAKSARNALSDEPSPKERLQAATKKTITKEFRGIEFEFEEFGQDALEVMRAGQGGDVEDNTEAAFMLYDKLGEHCVGVDFEDLTGDDIDADFWSGYDLGDDEGDGVVNLFTRVIHDSQDVDPEQAEAVGNSPNR